jgi:photosystem II stability/assembly factor-like uncharacterized protein
MKAGYFQRRYDEWNKNWKNRTQRNKWEKAGPNNIGGRITCLASPGEANLLAGSACGGTWYRENDDTEQWKSIGDLHETEESVCNQMHNIGALAVVTYLDTKADNNQEAKKVVYCGTGHAYHAGDSFPGVGIFKSENGGRKWNWFKRANDKSQIPHRISAIAVNSEDINNVLIGGVEVVLSSGEAPLTAAPDERPGMFYSRMEGGKPVWHRDNFRLQRQFASKIGAANKQLTEGVFLNKDYQCHSIVFCKANVDTGAGHFERKTAILAAVSGVLDWSGIWRSVKEERDGVAKEERGEMAVWEQLTRGLPPGREFGRTSLAVSPSDPSTVYAFIGSADGSCLGVFRSSDGGDHWSSPAGSEHFTVCGRLNYTSCIAVHPTDPDLVVCGADDLHRSKDGGQTWTQVTEWYASRNSSAYAHKDHHTLLWVRKTAKQKQESSDATAKKQEYRLYSGNDGGVDFSDDGGITWNNQSDGLANVMFYDIDVAPASTEQTGLLVAGGAQDNASIMTEIQAFGIGYIPTEAGVQLALDMQPLQRAELAQAMLHASAPAIRDIIVREGADMAMAGLELTYRAPEVTSTAAAEVTSTAAPEVASAALLENAKRPQLVIAAASSRVKPIVQAKSLDNQPHNFANILYGDGGWIVFDRSDSLHIYGSSQFMDIYRHRKDDGWVTVTPPEATDEERANTWMAFIAMHPSDPNVVFAGSTRLWRTQNDGENWKPVSDHLDGSPISAIEIADADPRFIYLGTEKGNIFKSTDGGNCWSEDGVSEPTPLNWRRDLEEMIPVPFGRAISRIEAHPKYPDLVVVTMLGFESPTNQKFPHVIWFDPNHHDPRDQTRPIGKWKNADNDGVLPNVHHNVVTWRSQEPYKVYVANDIGVWMSDDPVGEHGFAWLDVSANLPNAIVSDLVYHEASDTLTAATYGRSIWRRRAPLKADERPAGWAWASS